jgi:hypothetical protein
MGIRVAITISRSGRLFARHGRFFARRGRRFACCLAALALAGLGPRPACGSPVPPGDDGFVVVVNAANPVGVLPAAEISRLFLRKSLHWPSGETVRAVDLHQESPARESFSRAILARGTAAVEGYWRKMIFSGRDTPPPERSSPPEVLAYVRANLGAVGYVPGGTLLPDGVKELRVTR